MNTLQIAQKYDDMQKEIKELERALDAIGDEVGEDSKVWDMVNKEYKEKKMELVKYARTEWIEE